MGHAALDLTNKTAVVIGGTSGIGHTLAKGLARAGANVIATGRRADLVRSITDEIRALGRKSIAIASDVTDRASIEARGPAPVNDPGPGPGIAPSRPRDDGYR